MRKRCIPATVGDRVNGTIRLLKSQGRFRAAHVVEVRGKGPTDLPMKEAAKRCWRHLCKPGGLVHSQIAREVGMDPFEDSINASATRLDGSNS